MVGPQGLGQALGVARRCQCEVKLRPQRERWECSLLGGLIMELQHSGRQRMEIEHPADPAMIYGNRVARLDNPREFTRSERVGEREADDLLLHIRRDARFDRDLATCMGEGAAVEEPHKARALKTLQIAPELMIGNACGLTLLGKRALALEDRA